MVCPHLEKKQSRQKKVLLHKTYAGVLVEPRKGVGIQHVLLPPEPDLLSSFPLPCFAHLLPC